MKGSCFYCHRFTGTSSGPEAKILTAQLECIDKGLLSAAEIIQAEVNSIFEIRSDSNQGVRKRAPLLSTEEEQRIVEQIASVVSNLTKDQNSSSVALKPVKNTFKLRDGLVRDFLKNYLVNSLYRAFDLTLCFS